MVNIMGLFSKSPAEKKLKELTGGFLLSSTFIERLETKGLTTSDGTEIKNQLKEEIKSGKTDADGLELRLNYLINRKLEKTNSHKYIDCPKCGSNILKTDKICKFCKTRLDGKGNIDERFNNKNCPVCNTKVKRNINKCPNCEYDFINKQATKTVDCPICTKSVPYKSKKCPYCSADLTKDYKIIDSKKTKICPNCEKEVDEKVENCPYCNFLIEDLIAKPGTVHRLMDYKREVTFLYNQNHNLKICPDCGTNLLKTDDYCYKCGKAFTKIEETKELIKEESKSDEFSDLEKLYSKNIKSKYSPNFKFAYIKYLDAFSRNAKDKTIERIAKHYDTTPAKLMRQAKEDNYIDLAPPINGAYELKISELKGILKANDLKVSGKKDELIERIGENLDEKELKRLFPKKTYQITEEAHDFINKNRYILFLDKNKDIDYCFYPQEVESSLEEREYNDEELAQIFEKLLKGKLDYVIKDERWVDYKTFLKGLINVYEITDNLDCALDGHFKLFLYDLNNYSYVHKKAFPKTTCLSSRLMDSLNDLLHRMSLSIDELKKRFEDSYNDVTHEMVIPLEDSLVYLLRAFNGEDLDVINDEINKIYSNPY